MSLAVLAGVVIVVILFFKRGKTAKAIKKTGDREVWAQASDARFPRSPRRARPFGRRRGLR